MVSGSWFQAVGASAVDMGKSGLRSSIRSILKTLPWIFAKVVSEAQFNIHLTTRLDTLEDKINVTSCFEMLAEKCNFNGVF